MSNSYFAIPRDLYNLLQQKYRTKVFTNIVLVLNELAYRVRFNGNMHDNIKIGDALAGERDLSECLGITERGVRTALKSLQELTVIRRTSDGRGSVLSILDKRIFCDPSKAERPTSDEQVTTNIHPLPLKREREEEKKGEVEQGVRGVLLNEYKIKPSLLELIDSTYRDKDWVDRTLLSAVAHLRENENKYKDFGKFIVNWLKRGHGWDEANKPKETEAHLRYKETVRSLFKPHDNPNWE